MNMDDSFARGFCSYAQELGISLNDMLKSADNVIYPTRDLDRKERNKLYDELPEHRKEQIKKFIMEILNGKKDKSYVVKAKNNGIKGEFTYNPKKDILTEDNDQMQRNLQSRNHRLWTRKMWLGF